MKNQNLKQTISK